MEKKQQERTEMNTNSFIRDIVAVTIAVVVITAVAIPIIGGSILTSESGLTNYAQINTILQILPVFLVIAVLVGVIAMFVTSKRKA